MSRRPARDANAGARSARREGVPTNEIHAMSAMSAMNVTPPGPRVRAAARGMTLVELMVGMAVGLFVVLIAVAIFVSTRTLHSVGSASTRMSENARLAMDVLQTDIRNAAFVGCKPLLNDSPIIVLLAGDGGFLSTGPGMMGYRGTGFGFTPALTGPHRKARSTHRRAGRPRLRPPAVGHIGDRPRLVPCGCPTRTRRRRPSSERATQ